MNLKITREGYIILCSKIYENKTKRKMRSADGTEKVKVYTQHRTSIPWAIIQYLKIPNKRLYFSHIKSTVNTEFFKNNCAVSQDSSLRIFMSHEADTIRENKCNRPDYLKEYNKNDLITKRVYRGGNSKNPSYEFYIPKEIMWPGVTEAGFIIDLRTGENFFILV